MCAEGGGGREGKNGLAKLARFLKSLGMFGIFINHFAHSGARCVPLYTVRALALPLFYISYVSSTLALFSLLTEITASHGE